MEIKGPELTGYRSKAWIRQILRDPDSGRLFGHTKVFGMKSFASLPEADLAKLVDYIYGLRADPPRTNQPALAVSSRIGYRSLSTGGSNELA